MYKYKNAGKIDEIRTWLITGSNYKSGAARKKLHQKILHRDCSGGHSASAVPAAIALRGVDCNYG
jgi:hypothetical protein